MYFEALPSLLRWKTWADKQLGNLQHTEALETPLLTKKANWKIKEKEKIDFMWSTWTERAEVNFLFSYNQRFSACFYRICEVVQIPHHKDLFIYKTVYTYTLYM